MSDQNNDRVMEALFRVEAMSNDMTEIKVAIKEMARAVGRLAVIEERQTHDRSDIARAHGRLDKHEERIGVIEQAQPLQAQAADWVGKAVWAVVSAVIAISATLAVNFKFNPDTRLALPAVVAPK